MLCLSLIQYTVLSDLKIQVVLGQLQSKTFRLFLSCVVVNFKILILEKFACSGRGEEEKTLG